MRAPVQPSGQHPSAKGKDGSPRKSKKLQNPVSKGSQTKLRTQKSKGRTKNQKPRTSGSKKNQGGNPPTTENDVSPTREESHGKSPSRNQSKSSSTSRKRSLSTGSSKASSEVGIETPQSKNKSKIERGRCSQKSLLKSPKAKKSLSSKSPSQRENSASPKRNRKSSSNERGKLKQEKDTEDGFTREQRIAKSIEKVISSALGSDTSSECAANPPEVPAEPCAKSPKPKIKEKLIKIEGEDEGGRESPVPRKRGRPKGSKNKIKKENDKVGLKSNHRNVKKEKKQTKLEGLNTSDSKDSMEGKGKMKMTKLIKKTLKDPKKSKTSKKVLSSKLLKGKAIVKPNKSPSKILHKRLKTPKKNVPLYKEIETSESEAECKKVVRPKNKNPSKAKHNHGIESEPESKNKSPKREKKFSKVNSNSGLKMKSGGKSVSFPDSGKALKEKSDVVSDFSNDSEDEEDSGTSTSKSPPKKALKEKWSKEVKNSSDGEESDGRRRRKSYARRRGHPPVCYEEESDRDSEVEDSYQKNVKKGNKKDLNLPSRKRKRRKIEEDEEEDSSPATPKRAARMASLNAIAMMACMNEDAKVPLPVFPPQSSGENSSMALVLHESTIARRHSGDESDDSDDDDDNNDEDSDRGYSPNRKSVKRERTEETEKNDDKGTSAGKRRRRRRGELDVTMDMKDMVVTKRMASLNASAIMAASYSTEGRGCNKKNSGQVVIPDSRESQQVTKYSFKATKKQSLKTRSVITVQETTKKVKKAQTEGNTEVEEEHIIVKKKVKRQRGVHVEAATTDDGNATDDTDTEILPIKSPVAAADDDDSRMIVESTLTYVTTQTTHTVPQTVTLSDVREYSTISSSNGKTTTVVQTLQRKSTTTSSTTGAQLPSSTSSSTIPTAHIPPTQHVQGTQQESGRPPLPPRAPPPNYSPLGALEVMQPVMHHHHHHPPPPPPPPQHSSHYLPYPHPPHHMHHHPPPPPHHPHMPHHHITTHHHHPSSPYPPLSPHSPPYPPPPPSSTSPSSTPSSSPSCPPTSSTPNSSQSSPTTTPHPHPSPKPCQSPMGGYRSSAPCSPGYPPSTGPSKQIHHSIPHSPFREDRSPSYLPSMVSTNGPPSERHHSAFSAPMPSAHSAAVANPHGYQPVSGPIPTAVAQQQNSAAGGSSYKPPQGSPGGGGGVVASASPGAPPPPPPPYSSPSRLTSPPSPANKSSSSHYNTNEPPYSGPPHPYQSYPYPYDKYYPRTPAYHLYQPSYPGGQYPPGEYGYQPPPPTGTVHYSQESYTSYTLCVPAPPPHGGPVTHPSALALPPPPTSNAPHHHHNTPYTTYHCTEYTPMFPYPPAGPSQNAVCCPAGSSKNVPSGPLTGGKGPESSECGPKKQVPGTSSCNNYQYYGMPQNQPHQSSHMPPQGSQQQHQHPQQTLPPHSAGVSAQKSLPPPPPPPSLPPPAPPYTSHQDDLKEANHSSITEKSPSVNRVNPLRTTQMESSSKDVKPPLKSVKPFESLGYCQKMSQKSPLDCRDDRRSSCPSDIQMKKFQLPLALPTTSYTSSPGAISLSTSSLSTSSSALSSTSQVKPAGPDYAMIRNLQSKAPVLCASTGSANTTVTSSLAKNTPLLAIAASLPRHLQNTAPTIPSESSLKSHSVSPVAHSNQKHGTECSVDSVSANNFTLNKEEEGQNTTKSSAATSSASSANETPVPVFPAMPNRSSALQMTTWVVQPSASPTTSLSSSQPNNTTEVTPSYTLLLSPTNTTISVSLSNSSSSTNSVMSTTVPIVTSSETLKQNHQFKSSIFSEKSFNLKQELERPKERAIKEVGNKPTSLNRSGARHLLCQPLPLGHTKMTSVLAKVKPSNTLGIKPNSEETSKISVSSNFQPIETPNFTDGLILLSDAAKSLSKAPIKDDKDIFIPKKRGRPPKNREINFGTVSECASSNGTESKHFFSAPGEVSAREEKFARKRMSLLKSSGAKSSLAASPLSSQKKAKMMSLQPVHEFQGIKKDMKPSEDMKISVKTESFGKIKTEKVSPKLGFKEPKMKLLNGYSDLYNPLLPDKALKGGLIAPSIGLGTMEQQETLKRKLKSETDVEDTKEEKKVAKCGRPPKGLITRTKGPKSKTGTKLGRRKASLLAYLKEKNNESDASNGEGDVPIEDDLQKRKEEGEVKKSPLKTSPFPTYAMSIRGRRSSGTGKGKSIRKPKYYHGWSWEGEAHEGKVWLRNDEIMIIRKCYNSMKHKEGDTIKVRDCVLLRSGPRKTDLPFIAKVAALWEDPETSDMMMSILWYYRPEHTEAGRREEDLADEIFASKHRDHLSVACIEDRCYVLTFNEYCRYRRLLRIFQEKVCPPSSPVPDSEEGYVRKGRQPPGCVVQDLLFFCRKVYDYRQKRILKNPC